MMHDILCGATKRRDDEWKGVCVCVCVGDRPEVTRRKSNEAERPGSGQPRIQRSDSKSMRKAPSRLSSSSLYLVDSRYLHIRLECDVKFRVVCFRGDSPDVLLKLCTFYMFLFYNCYIIVI